MNATRTRQAPKALNKTTAQVAANAAAETARKTASKQALRSGRRKTDAAAQVVQVTANHLADPRSTITVEVPADVMARTVEAFAARKAEEAVNWERAMREDAAALGLDPDAYVAEQRADIAALEQADATKHYDGPMLILREKAKTYVKAANGILCNGDRLAEICGKYSREVVVDRLGKLLLAKGLTSDVNPYAHLNPGQQSMNLRNKARGALKNGFITLADIKAAFDKE